MEKLKEALKSMDLPCNEKIMNQFEQYRAEIFSWNEKVNLTAIKDPDEFEVKHFVDSLMAAKNSRMQEAKKIIDVGTGAGFPGIPLAIVYPEKKFVLMDSLGKRIRILEEISQNLSLKNVELIHDRAEELSRKKEHREQYDICLSRAVAHLAVLSEYCLPFIKVGGSFAAYKTIDFQQEVEESKKALQILGAVVSDQTDFFIDGEELGHTILWIDKNKNTGSKYPRKAGTPSKEPLK